jgi:flagellar basal-body rod protein FlgB
MAFGNFDTAQVLLAGMKTSAVRHKYIANNIANAETPNFTPTEVNFKDTLRATLEGRGDLALRTSHPRHLDFRKHHTDFEGLAFLSKNDYNKVDLDDQLSKLAENRGKYTTYARLLSKKFEMTAGLLDSLAR